MISIPVKKGTVGVSYNDFDKDGPFVLLQTTDNDSQSQTRVVLTLKDARKLIKRLQKQVELLEND